MARPVWQSNVEGLTTKGVLEVMSDTANTYITGNQIDASFTFDNYKVMLPWSLFPLFTL